MQKGPESSLYTLLLMGLWDVGRILYKTGS